MQVLEVWVRHSDAALTWGGALKNLIQHRGLAGLFLSVRGADYTPLIYTVSVCWVWFFCVAGLWG